MGRATSVPENEVTEIAVILWMETAELALPKMSLYLPDVRCLRLTIFWAFCDHVFQPSQLFLVAGLLSQSYCNLGKLPDERRYDIAMAACHASVMGSLVWRAFYVSP